MVSHCFCSRLAEYDLHGRHRVIVYGEEPRPAYDRVHLTNYFDRRSPDDLQLADGDWYDERGVELHTGARVVAIDRAARRVTATDGSTASYDHLVLATGSEAFVPPVPGVTRRGVFVYRTIEDLEAIIAWSAGRRRAAVIGGGLLGLEAARAVEGLGLETHVVELSPRLMPRQIDAQGSRFLERNVRAMNIALHLGKVARSFEGEDAIEAIRFDDGSLLPVDMIVISAGIKPRDELARLAGLPVGTRGGIVVDDTLTTSDPHIHAIGEVALHRGVTYGLVAPGYEMATVLARNLTGTSAAFTGTDQSARLKLLGTDVASFGDPFAETEKTSTIVYQDSRKGIYKKVLVSECGTKLLGGMLVGDASDYTQLLQLTRSGGPLPEAPQALVLGDVPTRGVRKELAETAQICSCNNVTKGELRGKIREGFQTIAQLKACTHAGTGCGGCLPLVSDVLQTELARLGRAVKPRLCEHFEYTRQELFEIVSVSGIRTFEELLTSRGRGQGCEICKPTVASILASTHNEFILRHATLQDTNDRFLANIQRQGLYSVIPRIPGGEITPEKLIVLGEVARRFNLYVKITGGQRIDLLGARMDQLPDIWEQLVQAGFESGHAYGKAMRTVKSCVGSTWCRYGVQDSVGFAIRVEERYKGLRAPHKLKSAVSGCIRECAEAQSKDFGLIATERGWNLYVCGNGGSKPRHAELLAADLNEETCLQYLDRFLMYYIRTADRLTRTATWVEKLEGGIEHIRDVVIRDSLGIATELERQMQALVDSYACEWTAVVNDPALRARFKHFANDDQPDPSIELELERGQPRPVAWPDPETGSRANVVPLRLPATPRQWIRAVRAEMVPRDGGVAIRHGRAQLALFHVAAEDRWYATQNNCPHTGDMVLSRGLLGDQQGVTKVACPVHKKTFSLHSGECLSGEALPPLHRFPTRIVDGWVEIEVPPTEELEKALCKGSAACSLDEPLQRSG
jgi:nitrite reductase (NADH) large subunit